MEVRTCSDLRRRVGCHRDFPPGCGPMFSGSGFASASTPHGCGPREQPLAIAAAAGGRGGVGFPGLTLEKVEMSPAKRAGPENRVSYPKKLHVSQNSPDKAEDTSWRRPVVAVRSKPATEMVSDGIKNGALVGMQKKPRTLYTDEGSRNHDDGGIGRGKGIMGEGSRNVGRDRGPREEIMETLTLFRARCAKLLSGRSEEKERRIDFQAKKELTAEGKLKRAVKMVGALPGVEVGDEFYYRVELFIVGLHGRLQNGIDYIGSGCSSVATCIVATEGYNDDMHDSDVLMYKGEGGIFMERGRLPRDQKMKGGNLALKNSMISRTPVRVVRGLKLGFCAGIPGAGTTTYVYDGLYSVTDCKKSKEPGGNHTYAFELKRCPGQPVVRWKKYRQ